MIAGNQIRVHLLKQADHHPGGRMAGCLESRDHQIGQITDPHPCANWNVCWLARRNNFIEFSLVSSAVHGPRIPGSFSRYLDGPDTLLVGVGVVHAVRVVGGVVGGVTCSCKKVSRSRLAPSHAALYPSLPHRSRRAVRRAHITARFAAGGGPNEVAALEEPQFEREKAPQAADLPQGQPLPPPSQKLLGFWPALHVVVFNV